jgi:hypothetical protein
LHPLAAAIRRGLVGAGASLLIPTALAQPAAGTDDIDEIVVTEDAAAARRYRVDDSALSNLRDSISDPPQSISTI